jgi:hypothetical protein
VDKVILVGGSTRVPAVQESPYPHRLSWLQHLSLLAL